MRISELYADSPVRGADVVIIGSGPSMTVFPVEMLRGRVCITLNDTHKYLPEWVGPISFSNALQWAEPSSAGIRIRIVKGRNRHQKRGPGPERTDNHVAWDHPRYHVFSYREPPWDERSHFDLESLWAEPDFYWNVKNGNVSIFAMQFAILAGARSMTMVGCDCMELEGKPYLDGKKQRSFVKRNFGAYLKGMMTMSREAHNRGIPVVTMSPFVGLQSFPMQWRQMKEW